MIERLDPPDLAGERDMLVGWLEFHRATVLRKCEGLDTEQLNRRAVPPSALSLHGLVRHLIDVERNWFDAVAHRRRPSKYWDAEIEGTDFTGGAPDEASFAEAIADLRAEFDESRRVLAGVELDDTFSDARRGPDQELSVRWVLVHLIEEYARHNGHADLLREAIDGSTGL